MVEMMSAARQRLTKASHGLTSRDLRLASGLVLGAFVLCHFANHVLGLVSLGAMEAVRPVLSGPWRTKAGAVLLYGSIAVHFALTLRALYRRRTLRMPAKEVWQTALGLGLPFLLIGHVVATRIDFAATGVQTTYPEIVRNFWIRNPLVGLQQAVALAIVWAHFCLGMYFWLRIKPRFRQYRAILFAVALLLPVLSLLGFAQAGKELAARPLPISARPSGVPDWIEPGLRLAFVIPIAIVLAARAVRAIRLRRDRVRIGYPDGRWVEVPRGYSVLEASRSAGIPHQAVCGGRARCSTCRVEVVRGSHGQAPPGDREGSTLERINAGPRVRLACQFRPLRNVDVVPLLSSSAAAGGALARVGSYGEEREIAVLFCDLRGFTALAEHRLPYDVVFILNRYFELVGRAVSDNGGVIDKFVGDGAIALFGLTGSIAKAAAQAIAAAERIVVDLAHMNETLARELREPVRIAIAVHHGPAIVGEIGYGKAAALTAVGDTINVASRLEGLAKSADAELVVSDATARSAEMALGGFASEVLSIRGRSRPMKVWLRRSLPT